MPTREELLKEAYDRDLLPPEMKSAYEEATKRGLVQSDGFVKRTVKKIGQTITGEGQKDPNVNEYSTHFGDTPSVTGDLRTARGMVFSTSEDQMRDVLKDNIPGAEFKQDEKGNSLVKIPGRDWEYINEPGLSWRDVINLVGQGALYLKGGKTAAKMAPKSLPLKAAAVAGTEAGISAGLDVAAQEAGSKQGVDVPRAVATGAMGGLAEGLVPVFSGIYRVIKNISGGGIRPSQAKTVLVNMGYSAEDLSDETVNKFIEIARKSASPEDAARLAEAQGLPVPVPLTRGKITMSPSDQMFEDLASKGAYGEGAERIIRGAESRTEEALRENIPAIRTKINPEGQVARNQAGEMAQQKITGKAKTMKGKIDEAYDIARKTEGIVSSETVGKIVDDIAMSVDDYMPHANMAKIEIDRLRNIIKGEADEIKPMNIKSVFDWRRRISKLANSAKDRTEAAALSKMVKQFDDSIDESIKTVLQSGDQKAVQAWKKAIGLRRGYGKIFESGDIVSELIESKGKKLKIAPEAASNYIFGVSDTKLLNRPEMIREMRKLRKILGTKSPEWNAIREEAFLRMAQRGETGAMSGGKFGFSGVNFKKAVNTIRTKNTAVWYTLFTEKERKLISQFANVAARVTNPVKGGANYSNTSVGISRLIRSLTDTLFVGEKGRALLSRIFPMAYESIQMGPAAKAAAGKIPLKQIQPGVAGAVGATIESKTGILEDF